MTTSHLHFSDTFRLAFANIREHKVRSLITVLTISIFFCFIICLNFLIDGLEQTLLHASVQNTDGQVYVTVPFYDESTPRSLRTQQELLTQYHGEIIGTLDSAYPTVSAPIFSYSFAEQFFATSSTQLVTDKLPTLVSADGLCTLLDDAETQRQADFYQIGTVPSTSCIYKLILPDNNPLNLLLGNVSGISYQNYYLVDDGADQLEQYLTAQGYDLDDIVNQNQPRSIVAFANYQDALAFDAHGTGLFGFFANLSERTNADQLFTNTLDIHRGFNFTRAILLLIEIFFFAAAIIITTMTFSHLIDQDATTIALYRSIGATTGNIHAVYLLYLLILCALAAFLSVLASLAITSLITLINSAPLSQVLQNYYLLSTAPAITLFSFDGYFWVTILLIFLSAPLTMAFSSSHFSSRNIAKQLKAN